MSLRPVTLNVGHSRPELDALLASRQFAFFETVTFKLTDGVTTLAYTNAPATFTVPPVDGGLTQQTYQAGDVGVTGLKFKASAGVGGQGGDDVTTSLEVDEMSLTLIPNLDPDAPSQIVGVPFLTAIGRGALDAAVVEWDRWFFPAPGGEAVGGVPMSYGFTASVDELTRTQCVMKVKSDLVLLNIQMPRNLYQPNCQYTVYSSDCGADPAAFVVHDVVGASPSASFIPWTGATAQFSAGKVFFEDGPNVGLTRTIRAGVAGVGLQLAYPLPFAPLAGDDFAAYPGCDRRLTGGCAFFARQSAFRAMPFTPPAVFAI